MPPSDSSAEITRLIQTVGAVRIVYGLIALFAPRFWPRFFRLDPSNEDARAWNAFLGSRDIALGLHALAAKDEARQRDAMLLNVGCELGDTVVWGQEIRHGRPFGLFTVAAIVFNGGMYAIWARVRMLSQR